MKASVIRSQFLQYFENNGHKVVESSSLVPQNDPTLLFTNAGMVQFKDFFLGNVNPPYSRATTSQKVVRAGGKHNDLENVGFTARHHTFFEMLGNFSFGDYFKREAIHYAWDFVTNVLKLPKELLYVTVYEKDDEAFEIWHQQEKVPQDRIYRFGEADNFWSMGETGPCGPCSELFIDRGQEYSCGKPTCKMGCDCDRYMEFWNLVFMQYERTADGELHPLPKPSVDTGAGLERLASILQKVDTNYDTDLFQEIITKIAQLVGIPYDRKAETAVSFRVIADHARATVFLIGDGVMPANEGRGYVLRRIMRRAIRHGRKLGYTDPFLTKTAAFVVDQMKDAYPDLVEKLPFIQKVVAAEEEQFLKTLEKGLLLLDEEMEKLQTSKGDKKVLNGEAAFKLYDTFGFPVDLTRVICEENGLSVDEAGFEKAMERQRSESRKHWKGSGEEAVQSVYLKLAQDLRDRNKVVKFVGYEKMDHPAECLAVLDPGSQSDAQTNPQMKKADEHIIEAVFAETPFYGESGGQVGDRGKIKGTGGDTFEGEVIDVQKPVPDLVVVRIRAVSSSNTAPGKLVVGHHYHQLVDLDSRHLTARNHTATHLLQWALRETLGKHVKQAGSIVNPELLRFDFTHFQPLTEEEVRRVENLINEKIWHAHPVRKEEMDKEAAVAAGAIAFFGEKYGDRVRVIQVGDFSTELCGGTHVDNSSEIHLFKIASESGIAAGVRRIVAHTSKGAFDYLREKDTQMKVIRDRLKASSTDEILGKLEKMSLNERELRRQIEQLQAKSASGEVDEILAKAQTLKGLKLVTAICASDPQGIKRLRELSDLIKNKLPDSVVVLGMGGEKPALLVAVGPQASKLANANELLQKIAPLIEGRGGGKADQAQAGGTQESGLQPALELAKSWLMEKLI